MNTNAYGFLKKIVLFSYGEGIVIPLSIRYDECRRPPRGAPAADWRVKNTPLPAVPRIGPETGVIHREHYFHGSGVN